MSQSQLPEQFDLQVLVKHRAVQVWYIFYLPDPAMCEFFLFSKLQIQIKSKEHDSVDSHQKSSFSGAPTNENLVGINELNAKGHEESERFIYCSSLSR